MGGEQTDGAGGWGESHNNPVRHRLSLSSLLQNQKHREVSRLLKVMQLVSGVGEI